MIETAIASMKRDLQRVTDIRTDYFKRFDKSSYDPNNGHQARIFAIYSRDVCETIATIYAKLRLVDDGDILEQYTPQSALAYLSDSNKQGEIARAFGFYLNRGNVMKDIDSLNGLADEMEYCYASL